MAKIVRKTTSGAGNDCAVDGCDAPTVFGMGYVHSRGCHYCGGEIELCAGHRDELVSEMIALVGRHLLD